ncbi:MAG: hypothetical protein HZC14_01110 [Candidatus Niyogibacteria bacterium]|nr:hypothetical protein [Candidatus Niyogibacteria bacterium]
MNEEEQISTELRAAQLQNMKKGGESAKNPMKPVVFALSFRQKILEHKIILITAAFFDIIAMIPFVSIATNPAFGLILFLYFGPKSKKGSEFLKIALPTGIGTIADTVSSAIPFADLIPFNIGVALIRIALS